MYNMQFKNLIYISFDKTYNYAFYTIINIIYISIFSPFVFHQINTKIFKRNFFRILFQFIMQHFKVISPKNLRKQKFRR